MDKSDDAQTSGDDKKGLEARTLEAMFKHYADVGLDHQRQSEATSRILLVIAGAIVTLIGVDGELIGIVDAVGAFAVAIIGGFGMVWSWKQHETYKYWTHIAEVFQEALFDLVLGPRPEGNVEGKADSEAAEEPSIQKPRPGMVDDLKKYANAKTAKEYGDFVVYRVHVRHLWVGVHGVVMLLGTLLASGILCMGEKQWEAIVVGLVLAVAMLWIVLVVVNLWGFWRRPKKECP